MNDDIKYVVAIIYNSRIHARVTNQLQLDDMNLFSFDSLIDNIYKMCIILIINLDNYFD